MGLPGAREGVRAGRADRRPRAARRGGGAIDDESCFASVGSDGPRTLALWIGLMDADFEVGENPDLAEVRAVGERYARAAGSRSPAIAFNDAINRRDLDALAELMTDDHTFIDSAGGVVSGKEAALRAWRGFFDAFPDYRNEWIEFIPQGGTAIAHGRSVCSSEPALDGPAIWTARTSGNQVSEWRVHEDTRAIRGELGIGREEP